MLKVYAMNTAGSDRHQVARALLRWKYEELWGRELPEISVTETGKPFFQDGPGYFSLSYSGEICCCALCDGPVGLDVERRRSVSSNAVQRILSPTEWVQYSLQEDPVIGFLRFWTLKEAYCKYTGEGLAGICLRETSFDISGEHPVLAGRDDLCFWSRKVSYGGEDLVISLCADGIHHPEFYYEEF